MKIITNPGHELHRPDRECFRQRCVPYREVPERITAIETALRPLRGVEFVPPDDTDMAMLTRVHDRDYLDYLERVSELAEGDEDYRAPYVIPGTAALPATERIDCLAQYAMDVTTPIGQATYAAAVQSAMAAATGAKLLLAGERQAYALCRPPGHHAERARYGGYCYCNNAAVAAELLAARGTVAIVDLDYHHGNGTQAVFYERGDVLYCSLHAEPRVAYPFFSGFAAETGRGAGAGLTRNVPLPRTTDDEDYLAALDETLAAVRAFAPAWLLVSLGFDAHRDDPVGGLDLSDKAYAAIGRRLARLQLPLLVVQEGGYNVATIGALARRTVEGMLAEGGQ